MKKRLKWILLGVFVIVLIPVLGFFSYYYFEKKASSLLSIQNWSGSDVQFEKAEINNQIIWQDSSVIFKTKKNTSKPWLDVHGSGPMQWFKAPKKELELKVVAINEKRGKDTVTCKLNNQLRPCFFEAFYFKGKLSCSDCDNTTLTD